MKNTEEKINKTFEEIIEEIKEFDDVKQTGEFCLLITTKTDAASKNENKKNVQATKYFAEIDVNIRTKVINYNLYKEDIDMHFSPDFLPKLIYIKGNEILADLPVYNYSILNNIE